MTAGLCKACGQMMLEDFYGDGLHPTCDERSQAAFRRMDAARRKGQMLAHLGKRQAMQADPKSASIGLQIIQAAAIKNHVLSADDVRDDLDAAGVPQAQRGGLFQAAVKDGVLSPVGEKPSGGVTAHGKKLNQYISLTYVSTKTARESSDDQTQRDTDQHAHRRREGVSVRPLR